MPLRTRLFAAFAVACILVAFGGSAARAQTVPPLPAPVTQSPLAPTGYAACGNATAAPFFVQGEVGGLVVGVIPVGGIGNLVPIPNVVGAAGPIIQVCSGFTQPAEQTTCAFDYDSPTGPVASQFSGEPPQKIPFNTSAGVAFDQVDAIDPDTGTTLRDATVELGGEDTACNKTSASAIPDVPYTPPAVVPGGSTVPGRTGSNLGTAAPIITPGPIQFVDVTTGQVLTSVGAPLDTLGGVTPPNDLLGLGTISANPLDPKVDGTDGSLTGNGENPTPISSVALTSNGGWIALLSIMMVCLCAFFAWMSLERGGKKRSKKLAAGTGTIATA